MKFRFCDFSWAHYRDIISSLKKTHRVILYPEAESVQTGERHAILRHDVDMSIDNAFDIAKIEHEVGIKATYFIRLDAVYYNPMTLSNYRILRQLLDYGHEIGLHYSASWSLVDRRSPYEIINRQLHIFQEFLGHEITVGAAHEPTRLNMDTQAISQKTELPLEAYAPRFVKAMKYISDSSGRWREGCACEWLDRDLDLCILTHPFWWYDKVPMERY